MRRFVPLAALLLVGACGLDLRTAPNPPPDGDGGDEIGEGEGEQPGEGEGEGEAPAEGEGEAPATCTPGERTGLCSAGIGLCRRSGALVCNADGLGSTCMATAAAPPTGSDPADPRSVDDSNDNRLDDDCDGQIDEAFVPTPVSGGGRFHVRIRDTEGLPVVGAPVQVTGAGTADGVTDEAGDFIVENLTFGAVHLSVTDDEYAPVRSALSHSPQNVSSVMEFVIKPVEAFTFSSEEGGVAAVEDARVTLPAGGYVSKLSGDPVVGPLEVRVAYFDGTVESDLRASPPLYRTDAGPGARLQTFGMIDVELFIHGEPVQLGTGATAALDLPLDQYAEDLAVYRTNYPQADTIPAWYWNDDDGQWVREGDGQIVEVEGALRWQATVSHFTRWNSDATYGDWTFACTSEGCYTCSRVPLWMRRCGTDVGRCQAGLLKCYDDGGHQVHLFDGNCTAGYCDPYTCEGEIGPTGESCNGQDDNCNGQTDEGYGVGNGCSVGVGQCRRNGSVVCSGGGSTCNVSPGSPSAEVCNDLDDDCDGATDEGMGKGDACAVGVGACRRTGTRVCAADGSVVCSATPGQPSPETCNNIDDDCDGEVDDNIGKGDVCVETASAGEKDALDTNDDGKVSGAEFDGRAAGIGICARKGVNICSPDETVVCSVSAAAPRTETCDSTDEDCDGVIDDDPSMLIEDQDANDRIPMPTIRGQEGETSGTAFAATCDCVLTCTNGVDQCIEVEAGVEYDLADPDTAAARGCVERVQG